MDDSAEAKSNDKETKNFQQTLMKKNQTYKTRNLYILLAFLLIAIALMIAVSIYFCLIAYRAK